MRLPTLRTSTRYAREALYLSVGAGVLAYQRLQVQRRELEAEWQRRFGGAEPASE
jgi:hypothetical protein